MKKYKRCPETQIWEENGKIMKEEIIRETGGEVDLTPHPFKNRLLMIDGELISIHSQEIIKHGTGNINLLTEILKEGIKKIKRYG